MYKEVIPAIYENLFELYHHSYDDTYETDFNKNPIDTTELRLEFREQIELINYPLLKMHESRILSRLDSMIKLCDNGLYLLGHGSRFSWTTGPWSVRLDTIKRIKNMINLSLPLKLPSYQKSCYKFYAPYGENDKVIVECHKIEFNKYHTVFYLKPDLYTINDVLCHMNNFQDCLSYENLNDSQLPFFMTYYEYERIEL